MKAKEAEMAGGVAWYKKHPLGQGLYHWGNGNK